MTLADASAAVGACRPVDATPVTVEADALETTADDYLRTLRLALVDDGLIPAELAVTVDFAADCSLTTQAEVDRVRDLLRAADYLGIGTVRLDVDGIADPGKVRPAVEALRERADRDGLELVVDPDDL